MSNTGYYLSEDTKAELDRLIGLMLEPGFRGGNANGGGTRQVGFVTVESGTDNPYTGTVQHADATGSITDFDTDIRIREFNGLKLKVGQTYLAVRTGYDNAGHAVFLTLQTLSNFTYKCLEVIVPPINIFCNSSGYPELDYSTKWIRFVGEVYDTCGDSSSLCECPSMSSMAMWLDAPGADWLRGPLPAIVIPPAAMQSDQFKAARQMREARKARSQQLATPNVQALSAEPRELPQMPAEFPELPDL